MKFKLVELKKLIRKLVKEAQDTPTISSDLSADEKTLRDKFPTWGDPRAKELKRESPNTVKLKQVTAILTKMGLTADARHKKLVTQKLPGFIDDIDPVDVFIAEPGEIANKFAQQVLGVKRD